MGPVTRPDKRAALEYLLSLGVVRVFVDCDAEGVEVPTGLRGLPTLVPFDVGCSMPVPIPDLAVDDAGVRCTLYFDGLGHQTCAFPWAAVHGAVLENGEGVVWMTRPALAPPPPPPAPPTRGGHLRLVD